MAARSRNGNGTLHNLIAVTAKLEGTVATMTEAWRTQELSASEGRRQLHNKFDDLKDKVTNDLTAVRLDAHDTKQTVAEIGNDIAEIRPEVETLKAIRLQAKGAGIVVKIIYAGIAGLIGAAVGAFGYMLHLSH
jgi:hypothetical protein